MTLSNAIASSNGRYTIVATNPLGAATSAVAFVSVYGAPPTFVQQPASTEVLQGSSVTLNSLASGSGPITYQWSFYGTNLPGGTRSQLVLTSVTPATAGPYFVVAANTFGATTSVTAQVSVNNSIVLAQSLTNEAGARCCWPCA